MPTDVDCKLFLAYVRNVIPQGPSHREAVAPRGLVHGARRGPSRRGAVASCGLVHGQPHGRHRARRGLSHRMASRHGAASPRTPPHVYASPNSMNTVWNKNATTHATPICRAKTAAAERPPSSERTVPIAATHGG